MQRDDPQVSSLQSSVLSDVAALHRDRCAQAVWRDVARSGRRRGPLLPSQCASQVRRGLARRHGPVPALRRRVAEAWLDRDDAGSSVLPMQRSSSAIRPRTQGRRPTRRRVPCRDGPRTAGIDLGMTLPNKALHHKDISSADRIVGSMGPTWEARRASRPPRQLKPCSVRQNGQR